MPFNFSNVAQAQGWTEATCLQVLKRFVDETGQNEHLGVFVCGVIAEESDMDTTGTPLPLGIDEACDALEESDGLQLYEVEIGLFDLPDEPNTAFDTRLVVVAASSTEDANDQAQQLCEKSIPVVRNVAFAPMAPAVVVSIDDYKD